MDFHVSQGKVSLSEYNNAKVEASDLKVKPIQTVWWLNSLAVMSAGHQNRIQKEEYNG